MVSLFWLTLGAGLLNELRCTRDQYGKLWIPDRHRFRSPSPISILGIEDYFYLNVRSMNGEGKLSYQQYIA